MPIVAMLQPAHAQPSEAPRSFALNWVREPGAETCMSSQMLARAIEQLLGPVFERPAEAELAIEGRIARDEHAASWHVSIRVTDAHGAVLGTRELSSSDASCHAVDAQVVLVIGMAIDPEIALRGLPDDLLAEFPVQNDAARQLLDELREERKQKVAATSAAREIAEPKPKPISAEPPPVPQPKSDSDPARETPAWHAEPFAAASIVAGLQPATAAGLGLGVRVQSPSWWALEMNATLWLPVDAPLTDSVAHDPSSVRFRGWQTAFGFCPQLLDTLRWRLSACAGATLGVRIHDASTLERQSGSTHVYWAPTAGAELAFRPWRAIFVMASAAAGLVLPRNRYYYNDANDHRRALFTPSLAAVWALLAAGVRF